MKRVLAGFVTLGAIAMANTTMAGTDLCNLPMTEWQKPETLRVKLVADGWQIKRIKTDDGCYEVYAITAEGKRIEAYFNPVTFDMVKVEEEG